MGGQNYSELVYINIFPVSFWNLLLCSLGKKQTLKTQFKEKKKRMLIHLQFILTNNNTRVHLVKKTLSRSTVVLIIVFLARTTRAVSTEFA